MQKRLNGAQVRISRVALRATLCNQLGSSCPQRQIIMKMVKMAEDKKEMVNKKVPKEKMPEKKAEEKEHLLEIVRILSTDLNGKNKIRNSLRKIKGIRYG